MPGDLFRRADELNTLRDKLDSIDLDRYGILDKSRSYNTKF